MLVAAERSIDLKPGHGPDLGFRLEAFDVGVADVARDGVGRRKGRTDVRAGQHRQLNIGVAAQCPKELADLDARIERLPERQRTGDPDLPTDELQDAIDRALEKHSQLEAALPEARQSAAVLAALPNSLGENRASARPWSHPLG
jgi:hypothetical protein